MSRPPFFVTALLVLGLSACGPTEPAGDVEKTAPTGAGTVVKNDPALDAIVPADYEIEKLAGNLMFTEGPLWVEEGGPYLLFSDVRGNANYKWDPASGQVSDFRKPVYPGDYEEGQYVGPNGITLDPQGRIIICEHANRRIVRIEKDGSETVIADKYNGKRLNSPNDIVYKSDGWAYFTDPPYGLPKQDDDPAKELAFNGIYRLNSDGKVELLNDQQTRPNGLAFSPDEKTLYVGNSDAARKVWMTYGVNDDGTLDEGRVFHDATAETAEGLPDGLKVDKQGNLYLTGPGGVWIFSPEGKHLGTIQADEVPANVGWGDDGKVLYMTARTGLYRIRLNAEGVRP